MAAAGGHNKGTWKDRLGYFWMYYSVPTILVVIALAAVISFVHANLTTPPAALNVMLLDVGTSADDDALAQAFADAAGIDTDTHGVTIVTSLMLDHTNSNYQMSSIAKLYSEIGTGDVDVVAMSESDYANYSKADMFLDLRDVFTEEELAAFPECYANTSGQIIGIYCEEMPGIRAIDGYSDGERAVIGIVYNTEHVDAARMYLEYLNSTE